jgi:hypothetical protein
MSLFNFPGFIVSISLSFFMTFYQKLASIFFNQEGFPLMSDDTLHRLLEVSRRVNAGVSVKQVNAGALDMGKA